MWIGTSLSKPLHVRQFEKETKTAVKMVKAFGIKNESNQLYPDKNFTDTVPGVVKNEKPDVLVLQCGSIEISNIDVKRALIDGEKDIEDYKKEWFVKIEEDSANIFDVAERAIKQKPNMKVIIVKRLPRFDQPSADPLGIRKIICF